MTTPLEASVCGWCRDGRGMEQMREGHNFRAELEVMTGCGGIDGDRIEGEEEIVVEGYQ